ncbi:oligopeptide ABC transporter permease [Effusibacillus pohliae]|uniref:oligopeptide ABC transporter permease n=1 Tax=Effusibacillus pohliae TaxID=232270 RepID=UPI000378404F
MMRLQTDGAATGVQPVAGTLPIKKTSMLRIIWERFSRNKLAVAGLVFILLVAVLAILAPWIAPYDPAEQDLLKKLKPPSAEHWLGTDDFGRDIFSRLLHGARISLSVGILTVLGWIVIGTAVGALAGYYGGKVDNILMRMVDIIIAFPDILLLIAVVSMFKPSVANIILILILLRWTSIARLVRGEFLSLKNREFVLAAKTLGLSDVRIIFVHILPNALAPIIVASTLGIGYTILTESALSFLGLGVQPPTASWGNMLQGAQSISILMKAPWYPVAPGLMILLTVLSVNFVGDGLRDALDPRLK